MGVIGTPLLDEARTIFSDLGYEVEKDGDELRAERKWRTVFVTTADPADAPTRGRLRCFVTEESRAAEIRDQLVSLAPDYDWAIVAVDNGDYRILHPDAEALSAP
ncbi:MAG: hypothetical protein ABEJ05_04485 [Haloglomus sp.]